MLVFELADDALKPGLLAGEVLVARANLINVGFMANIIQLSLAHQFLLPQGQIREHEDEVQLQARVLQRTFLDWSDDAVSGIDREIAKIYSDLTPLLLYRPLHKEQLELKCGRGGRNEKL